MPVTFDQLLRLADAPAAVLLVLLVSLILIGAIRRWWVPGYLWDREVLRGDRNDEALVKATAALDVANARLNKLELVLDDILWNRRDRHEVRRGPDA